MARGYKQAPYQWPEFRLGNAQWTLVDIEAYLENGFASNSLIYSAIMYKAIASSIPAMRAYSGTSDNPEPLAPNHPLAKLVQMPNPSMSWPEYQMGQEISLCVAGDAYTYIDRKDSERGVPAALYPLNPLRVRIIPDRDRRKRIGYLYVPEGFGERDGVPILPKDMIHVKMPNPMDALDGEGYGLSQLAAAARSDDVDNQVTKYLQIFFERGAMPPGILKFNVPLDNAVIGQIKERWREVYGGVDNWTHIGVLDQGAEYQRLSLSFEEMGFETLDERNETRILSTLGVPPILIGSRVGLARSTYSNYEQARSAFWEDRMLGEMRLFQEAYRYYLTSEDGGFVGYDYSDVPALQRSIPGMVTAWTQLVQNGIPKNIAAEVVGLKLPELPDGQVVYMPANMIPIGASAPELPATGQAETATTDDRAKALMELANEIKLARMAIDKK